MTEGKRPGGLTALAVVNFVFAGFEMLGLMLIGVGIAILSAAGEGGELDEAQRQIAEEIEASGVGLGFLVAVLAVSFVQSVLMIVAAIGYLKQRRVMGRIVGNVYAVLALGTVAVSALFMPSGVGGGATLAAIMELIYPIVTLWCLNAVFKEDFIH